MKKYVVIRTIKKVIILIKKKEEIISKAKNIQDSADWKKTTEELKRAQQPYGFGDLSQTTIQKTILILVR